MKILFLARRFYPDIGGVEKHVLEISKRLAAIGHEVTVVAEGISTKETALFEKKIGIKVF
ncbi:MAG TPA: glycosyltransferase, partial [Patescibacteria group bacterium]